MAQYLMKNKEIIEAQNFNELRKIIIKKLTDDYYLRQWIKGVRIK